VAANGIDFKDNLVKIGHCFNCWNVGTDRHTQRKHSDFI